MAAFHIHKEAVMTQSMIGWVVGLAVVAVVAVALARRYQSEHSSMEVAGLPSLGVDASQTLTSRRWRR
ncbi:hypothetical protein [Burkholderia cenocepacia]|uniref:hypothetical protein n=1 Tax=Burkholderia cenocepacia TaxID=95486 RepID=UPI0015EBC70C|nr:hypothetical protein [Burkholderia cenocepacia]